VLFNVDGNSKDYIVSVLGEWLSIELWWNDSDGGQKPKCSEKNMSVSLCPS